MKSRESSLLLLQWVHSLQGLFSFIISKPAEVLSFHSQNKKSSRQLFKKTKKGLYFLYRTSHCLHFSKQLVVNYDVNISLHDIAAGKSFVELDK